MGRGKVELKRIEDKSSRQVRFAKRRRGLMKKAHELSVLCDVEVAVFIFSGRDRLYEFSSGDSLRKIVDRYQNHRSAEEVVRNAQDIHGDGKLGAEDRDMLETADPLQMVQRPDDWQKVEQLDMTELTRLEHQLDAITRQTRIRKTRLLMEAMTALHEKEIQIIEKELTAAINETDDHQVPPPSPPPPLPLPPGFWN